MTDLTDWLRSALDEHERIARAAAGPGYLYDSEGLSDATTAHVALNDPAHVLRTVQAHREILDRHSPDVIPTDDAYCFGCVCSHRECPAEPPDWPCRNVRSLAAIYQDQHPGFDPSWIEERSG